MANKVPQTPAVNPPLGLTDQAGVAAYLINLYNSLNGVLQSYAVAINSLVDDETKPLIPVGLPAYAKASLPSAATYINAMIIVTDDIGGLTPAFSDGTNWRRTADRNVIS